MSNAVAVQGCSCGGISLVEQMSNAVPASEARSCFWHPTDLVLKVLNREELSTGAIVNRCPSHISIAVPAKRMWSMRLLCRQFPIRFFELMKIVRVCYEPSESTPGRVTIVPAEDNKIEPTMGASLPIIPAEDYNIAPPTTESYLPIIPAEDYSIVPPTTEAEASLPVVPAEDVDIVPPRESSLPIDDFGLHNERNVYCHKPDDPGNNDHTEAVLHARGSQSHVSIATIASFMWLLTAASARVRRSNTRSHISIATIVSLMCPLRLPCQFPFGSLEPVKTVRVCRESPRGPFHVSIAVHARLMWLMKPLCRFPLRFFELVQIVRVCQVYQCQPPSLRAGDIFSRIFAQTTSTYSDRSTIIQMSVYHLNLLIFRRQHQSSTLHGLADVFNLPFGTTSSLPLVPVYGHCLADVYNLPFGSTSSCLLLLPVYVPCERSLPLIYLPLFFIVSMKMGHAYIGSDCPERHFRSNYPEVTTRRNDPILSWSHLRASLIHELAEDPSIRIYYPSCDSIPSNLPHVSVFWALQEASSVDLFHTRSNPLSPASFNLRDLAEELSKLRRSEG